MDKHNQLVRQIAEEMAEAKHGELYLKAKESTVDFFMPAARIAVKHMERFYTKGWRDNKISNYDETMTLGSCLSDNGLIP